MTRRGAPIDARLRGLPRDYFVEPHKFGWDDSIPIEVPPHGDELSARIAYRQHLLVLRWRRSPRSMSGARLAYLFGFSRQTWSRTINGHRWAGQVGCDALRYGIAVARAAQRQVDGQAAPGSGCPGSATSSAISSP